MNDRQSPRGFLDMVQTRFPEELLRITQPVDLRFETTALVVELERLPQPRRHVREPGGRVRAHHAAGDEHRRQSRVAGRLHGCRGADLPDGFLDRCQHYLPCEMDRKAHPPKSAR